MGQEIQETEVQNEAFVIVGECPVTLYRLETQDSIITVIGDRVKDTLTRLVFRVESIGDEAERIDHSQLQLSKFGNSPISFTEAHFIPVDRNLFLKGDIQFVFTDIVNQRAGYVTYSITFNGKALIEIIPAIAYQSIGFRIVLPA